jgi:GT2 family glycosyltransferase
MTNPLISVIIANYNGEPFLTDCLSSLSGQTFRNFEVILVDNGSTDGSLNLVKKRFSWVRLITLNENTGFARGNNTGFKASSSPYVATLNNDTIVDRGWLHALHEAAEADLRIGMVASKIMLGREGREIDSVGLLIYPDGMTRQKGRGDRDEGQYDSLKEVLMPSACAALFRREMLEETGYFDEDFFSYCEDSDLGLRGRLAGWKAVLAPEAVVRHLYSGTGGRYSDFKAYHVERNRSWVLLKDLPVSYVIASPLYTIWRYIIQVFGILTGRGSVARFAEGSGKMRMISTVTRATRDALMKVPSMIMKRRGIWKRRRLGREEFRLLLKKNRITAKELMLRD